VSSLFAVEHSGSVATGGMYTRRASLWLCWSSSTASSLV